MLRLRHWLPGRLRLQLARGDIRGAEQLALWLGAQWHGYSGSMVLTEVPNLGDLAEKLEQLGWWLEAPSPSRTPPAANRPWEQITLEVGASLMGASLGEPLGRWLGASLAGPPGAAAGSFLGLVLGAVLATETLDQQRNRGKIADELSQVKTRVRGRVAGRLGEEAGALAGLRIGGLLGGPLGASAGALLGTLLVGQLGEDAALHRTKQWLHPWQWLRHTGSAAAGEAASQSIFGLVGGALLSSPGRKAGERLGLYLGRRVDWQRLAPLAS